MGIQNALFIRVSKCGRSVSLDTGSRSTYPLILPVCLPLVQSWTATTYVSYTTWSGMPSPSLDNAETAAFQLVVLVSGRATLVNWDWGLSHQTAF